MDRRATALCMREVLDHLNRCCEQWQSGDGRLESFMVQSMERDLAELQRICRTVRRFEMSGVEDREPALRAA